MVSVNLVQLNKLDYKELMLDSASILEGFRQKSSP